MDFVSSCSGLRHRQESSWCGDVRSDCDAALSNDRTRHVIDPCICDCVKVAEVRLSDPLCDQELTQLPDGLVAIEHS